ncbi:MAG: serine/threonine protein kinase [Akkermansiaceae bacterium]|jgi:serine/threonine protein kinase
MEIPERYEIRRKLGQGGVGAVYEGYDHQLRRRVAIKRLLETDESRSDQAVAELLKECHSLSALNSPNIVRLFDFGEDADGPFVVMELLDGETLEELITKAPFTEPDFMVLAEQSLEGLLAAHDAHLLHRDLKPCNFMVTWLPSGRMQLKILDFGLAKFSVGPSKQTIEHGNSLFGSIYFMAPEQFEQLHLDSRTDLYALGTVFYYALTGIYPFNGETVAQVMASHLTGHYKDLREYRPDMNPEVCKWIMSLISRKPQHRPDSCSVALAQFMGMQNGTYIPHEPVRADQTPTAPDPQQNDPAARPISPQTNTVSLLLPRAERDTAPLRLHPGRVTLQTGIVPTAGQSQALTAAVPLSQRPPEHTGAIHVKSPIATALVSQPAAIHTGAIGLPPQPAPIPPTQATFLPPPAISKSTLHASLTGILILSGFVAFLLLRDRGSVTDDQDIGLKPEHAKLPNREDLIRDLSLPKDAATLLTRRDSDNDSQLSLKEFAVAPTQARKEKLEEIFPLMDKNNDRFLSLNELNQAYQSDD